MGNSIVGGLGYLASLQQSAENSRIQAQSEAEKTRVSMRQLELDNQRFILDLAKERRAENDQAASHYLQLQKMNEEQRERDLRMKKLEMEVSKEEKRQTALEDPRASAGLSFISDPSKPVLAHAARKNLGDLGTWLYLTPEERTQYQNGLTEAAKVNYTTDVGVFTSAGDLAGWLFSDDTDKRQKGIQAAKEEGATYEDLMALTGGRLSATDYEEASKWSAIVSATKSVGLAEQTELTQLLNEDLPRVELGITRVLSGVRQFDDVKEKNAELDRLNKSRDDLLGRKRTLVSQIAGAGLRVDTQGRLVPVDAPYEKVSYMRQQAARLGRGVGANPDWLAKQQQFAAAVAELSAQYAGDPERLQAEIGALSEQVPDNLGRANALLDELQAALPDMISSDPLSKIPKEREEAEIAYSKVTKILVNLHDFFKNAGGNSRMVSPADFIGEEYARALYNQQRAKFARENGKTQVAAPPGSKSNTIPAEALLNMVLSGAGKTPPPELKGKDAEAYLKFFEPGGVAYQELENFEDPIWIFQGFYKPSKADIAESAGRNLDGTVKRNEETGRPVGANPVSDRYAAAWKGAKNHPGAIYADKKLTDLDGRKASRQLTQASVYMKPYISMIIGERTMSGEWPTAAISKAISVPESYLVTTSLSQGSLIPGEETGVSSFMTGVGHGIGFISSVGTFGIVPSLITLSGRLGEALGDAEKTTVPEGFAPGVTNFNQFKQLALSRGALMEAAELSGKGRAASASRIVGRLVFAYEANRQYKEDLGGGDRAEEVADIGLAFEGTPEDTAFVKARIYDRLVSLDPDDAKFAQGLKTELKKRGIPYDEFFNWLDDGLNIGSWSLYDEELERARSTGLATGVQVPSAPSAPAGR